MPSTSPQLEQFVRDALLQGQSKEAIQQALSAAGWSIEQTRGVLDDYADVAFPVPVPKPRASLSAREAFQYLLLFAALYFCAWNLGSLQFDLINRWIPDAADISHRYGMLGGDSMRWSMAAVLIGFPVFVLMARNLSREVEKFPIKRLSPVRRWLTYVTLFLTASILIGDMTTLLYKLLGGELSVRFVLKVLVVAVIAGGIFGYYLWDLRREEVQA